MSHVIEKGVEEATTHNARMNNKASVETKGIHRTRSKSVSLNGSYHDLKLDNLDN